MAAIVFEDKGLPIGHIAPQTNTICFIYSTAVPPAGERERYRKAGVAATVLNACTQTSSEGGVRYLWGERERGWGAGRVAAMLRSL